MSTKSHIHKTYGTLKKTSFCTKGYAEIHIQRPFFDNKNSIWKILGLNIRMMETCSSAPLLRVQIFIFKATKTEKIHFGCPWCVGVDKNGLYDMKMGNLFCSLLATPTIQTIKTVNPLAP
jgi:hypothetical protein